MAEDKHDAEHALSDSDTTTDEQQVLAQTSEAEEKRLLRKLDLRLLPAVSILYLLSFLDRSNVANARIEGLTTDLKMTGNQYLTGLTLYFVGYVLFEIPCNIVLKRTTPRFWLSPLSSQSSSLSSPNATPAAPPSSSSLPPWQSSATSSYSQTRIRVHAQAFHM